MRELSLGRSVVRAAVLLAALGSAPAYLMSSSDLPGPPPVLIIPRVTRAPVIEDFLEMKPNGEMGRQLTKVEDFIQKSPADGKPSSQRTEVYLGYDDRNLYVIFLCFDLEPQKIRARMTQRENIFGDDLVLVTLDTFHDQRRSYEFWANPFAVQMDDQWIEGQPFDTSFDMLWHSRGQLTEQGYVVLMAIPFESLRFPSTPEQTWGVILWRVIPRVNEFSAWPHISSRIEGELNQAATLRGLHNIPPGRNVQLIPYGFLRSFRALDTLDPAQPRFVSKTVDPYAGLDAKFVFKDSLVLDVALNPDFSQVESDQPQVTANQRFEVFFPEKRPFFLENANFFETSINLFFTRRIADPQFGIRLTGKKGPYTVAALLADDESPGKSVPVDDPLSGQRARFGIVRINRDLFQHSTVGLIYADREFEGNFNRVGGLDGRLKWGKNWVASFQGVASSTRFLDGSQLAGPAYDAQLRRSGRKFINVLEFNDRSPGFRTQTGFLPGRSSGFISRRLRTDRVSLRPDIRSLRQFASYRFRPEGKYLISWGPDVTINPTWDHSGTRLDFLYAGAMSWEFTGQTYLGLFHDGARERLRPQDFEGLPENRDFSHNRKGFFLRTSYLPEVNFEGEYSLGTRINFVPPDGQEPMIANLNRGKFGLILRPRTRLRIDNSYILERLTHRAGGANIFNNHIVRSKWNWQFNRELSLRAILQYNTVLANPELTSLETSKNFNADFLLTYLVNPWTALYVGYNGNVQNIELLETPAGSEIIRSPHFINDAKQFFIKFSYLLRF